MGNAASRSTKTKSTPNGETIGGGMARGKTVEIIENEMIINGEDADLANKVESLASESFPSDEEEHTEESDYDTDEEDEEDEEMMERLRVLDDARKLKQLAEAFLYPERRVETTDETACARNYFNRASAEVPEEDEAAEYACIMEDAKALKYFAVAFAHPEIPVVTTDETACGRSYFDRASAPEQESMEEAEERARILADAQALKKQAAGWAYPEIPVVTMDETACGRNYFDRASAPEQESMEEAEERASILADAQALKKLAADYAHPEAPVVTTDETACGRNYFDRVSAPEQESMEDVDERTQLMEDLQALKMLAIDYAHPELSVFTTDDTACGRLYFNRASAVEQESMEEAEERARILADAQALKKQAVDYMHPETPVATTDETACGRNYFDRASAAEVESVEEAEERASILADAQALKKLAVDYMQPEIPVVTTDDTACGRSYFDRASAPIVEGMEDVDERTQLMEDLQALKKLAIDYLHPELSVFTTDDTACGRLYFNRASAVEQEEEEEAAERSLVMQDLTALRKLAKDYLHPELPVESTDETACARNYFGRASAEEMESVEEAEERARILADAQALKKLAADYAHPEAPVVTTDPTACGRNYYVRASAKGNNFITTSSTLEEPIKYIEHEIEDDHYLDECDDYHFGEFELDEENVCDLKYEVHKLLRFSSISSIDPDQVQGPITEEEEGKLSRSPSSVMLFGGGYEQAA